MAHSTNTLVLSAALAAAAGFALGRFTGPSEPTVTTASPLPDPPRMAPATPQGDNPHAGRDPHAGGQDPHAGGQAPMFAESAPNEKQAITWSKPAAWQEAPNPNSMRLATYLTPDQAELAVSRAGGALDANIDRWAGQFGEEGKSKLARETRKVEGIEVTIVTTSGSSYAGMSGEVKQGEEMALLAAIVPSPDGSDQAYFFKMTGPKKSVDSARKDFDGLIGSIRKSDAK